MRTRKYCKMIFKVLRNDWLVKFQGKKCRVIHYGKTEAVYKLHEEGDNLANSHMERDLGVLFTSDLKWKAHIHEITSKANRILGRLKRTFAVADVESIRLLYVSLIRPHLEFAVPVWSPYFKTDIEALERVQRRVLKWVNFGRKISYKEKMKRFGLTSLVERRQRGDLIQLFKWFKGFECIRSNSTPNFNATIKTRGNCMKFRRELNKISNARHHFLLNRTARLWNKLSDEAVLSKKVNSFKARIDKELNWNLTG